MPLSRGLLGIWAILWAASAGATPLDRLTEWRQFRTAYPYHIQTVALSRPDGSGKRLLIVSEPPPGVSLNQIEQVSRDLLSGGIIRWSRVGYDGAVADALFEVPAMDEGRLRGLVESLHVKLFGTAYKAYAVEIPRQPPRNRDYSLDLHVTTGALAHWLAPPERGSTTVSWALVFVFGVLTLFGLRFFGGHQVTRALGLGIGICGLAFQLAPPVWHRLSREPDRSMRFTPIMGGKSQTAAEILAARTSGVYASDQPGVVLWVVPRKGPLAAQRREMRWFTLDSDMVLGAMADANSIAIVGRERVAPIELLPPLRTETILLLAAVKENELAQSYERNHFFAGPTRAGVDWAPIYLSDALIDTEYGSLLNITDQLLKSWSMHGQIEYVNFPYPKPAASDYPFSKPLVEEVKVDSVTFNWNTKGAGYSSLTRGFDFFAWNRTGALPVDYLGDSNAELRNAEETGYSYFAKRNDPNLVRVVQYAQLYQMFRHYGITTPAKEPAFHLGAPPEFHAALVAMLERVSTIDEARIDALPSEEAEEIHKVKSSIVRLQAQRGEEVLGELADAIAAPRLYDRAHNGRDADQLRGVAHACERQKRVLLGATRLTRDQAMEDYVRYTRRDSKGSIYTPSIVQSWATGSLAGGVGGHNLDSVITSFRASPDLAVGEIKVVEENGMRVVLHNPADADRIGETVRTAARAAGPEGEVETSVQKALAVAHEEIRPLSEVLLTGTRRADAARGLAPAHMRRSIEHTGWLAHDFSLSEKQAALITALNTDGSHAIVVERTSQGGYMLFDGPSRRILEADNEPAAIDALLAYSVGRKGTPVRLHLRGFDPRTARGFTQSAELQMAGFGEVPEIRATLEPSEFEAAKLKVLLTERYNFRKVTIKEVSAPFVTESGEMAVHVDAEVASATAKEPLHVRFFVAVKRGIAMTAEMVQQIVSVITNAFRSGEIVAADDGSFLLTDKILRDLRKIHPDITEVHGKIDHKEVKDLYIVMQRYLQRLTEMLG